MLEDDRRATVNVAREKMGYDSPTPTGLPPRNVNVDLTLSLFNLDAVLAEDVVARIRALIGYDAEIMVHYSKPLVD